MSDRWEALECHPALALLELGPGMRCLDAGSGLGEDAGAIADLSGARVVGVDRSARMSAVARSRAGDDARLAFVTADARRLPFADASFDAAWIKRTLMHLDTPAAVVSELTRVVSPGGRVVAVEPDLEVVLIDSGLVDATRQVLARRTASYASPWIGRQLRATFLAAGLTDVRVHADHAELTDLATADRTLRLLDLARAALTPEVAARWEEDLRARDAAGRFACYVPWFIARGRVN